MSFLRDMVFCPLFLYWNSGNPIQDACAGRHVSPVPKSRFLAFSAVVGGRDQTTRLYDQLEEGGLPGDRVFVVEAGKHEEEDEEETGRAADEHLEAQQKEQERPDEGEEEEEKEEDEELEVSLEYSPTGSEGSEKSVNVQDIYPNIRAPAADFYDGLQGYTLS